MNNLPICMDVLKKRSEIPKIIAEISYQDENKAIYYMRVWGEKRKPITELHDELLKTNNETENV